MKITQMKFACLTEKGHAEVRKRELPKLGDDQVLVKQMACNICTADYTQWLGLREHQGYPQAGGHEGSGFIIEKGSSVKNFEKEDLISPCLYGCGTCDSCKQGYQSLCTGTDYSFTTHDGYHTGIFGFADYFVRDSRKLVKLDNKLSPSEAGFLEPLATVIKGFTKLQIQPLETIVIVGAGTMGLLNAMAARAMNCRVILTEILSNKISKAKEMGFEVIDISILDPVEEIKKMTNGNGADAAIMATGKTKANSQAIQMVKNKDGRILFFAASYPPPELLINSNDIHYRRLQLIGTIGADMVDHFTAAKMLSSRIIDVSGLIEPIHYTLDNIQQAFQHAATPGTYRVSVMLNDY